MSTRNQLLEDFVSKDFPTAEVIAENRRRAEPPNNCPPTKPLTTADIETSAANLATSSFETVQASFRRLSGV